MSMSEHLAEITELYNSGDLTEDFTRWRQYYEAKEGKPSALTDVDLIKIMAAAEDDKMPSEWHQDMLNAEKAKVS